MVTVCETCGSGGLLDRGHAEVAGDGAVDGLEGAQPVLVGGVEVGAHVGPGRRAVFGLVAAGVLQLGLDRSQCPLAAVVGEGHMPGVVGEVQDRVGLVPQAFGQVGGRGLFAARRPGVLGESGCDALGEGIQVQQQGIGVDLAGLTRAHPQGLGVQSGQGPPDLLVPLLVGEVLLGGGEFADQVGAAQLVTAVGVSGMEGQRVVDQDAAVVRQDAARRWCRLVSAG